MKYFFMFLCFLSNQASFAQTKNTKLFDSNGKLYAIIQFVGGKKVKEILYHSNGSVKEVSQISNDRPFGWRSFFSEKGVLLQKQFIFEYIENFPTSFIDSTEVTGNAVDVFNSIEFNYYSNGKLKSTGIVLYGIPVGLWKYYDESGRLIKEEFLKTLQRNKSPR